MRFVPVSDPAQSYIHNLLLQSDYTRAKTLSLAGGLTQAELDCVIHPDLNSIGMLLKHIAALAKFMHCRVFENRPLNNHEMEAWADALAPHMHLKLVHGREFAYYNSLLDESASSMRRSLLEKDDKWLFETCPEDTRRNQTNYYWLFHRMEDELCHIGQMKIIEKFIRRRRS
jgi:hypothetical protein